MIGLGPAGVWTILAKGILGSTVDRIAVDMGPWRFKDVSHPDDPRLIPGARKYGDLGRLTLLCAPSPMLVAGATPKEAELLKQAYGWLEHPSDFSAVDSLACDAAVEWIMK